MVSWLDCVLPCNEAVAQPTRVQRRPCLALLFRYPHTRTKPTQDRLYAVTNSGGVTIHWGPGSILSLSVVWWASSEGKPSLGAYERIAMSVYGSGPGVTSHTASLGQHFRRREDRAACLQQGVLRASLARQIMVTSVG